jgi:hypothetical protein
MRPIRAKINKIVAKNRYGVAVDWRANLVVSITSIPASAPV